jgi:transcriptional regulator with XRE-family HTH domain
MAYTTEQIAQNLKAAREAKGLSQRALAKMADVPQSHISRIENGAVDLRLSSLIEIGRALDLEVTLVPRRTLPAVQSIVRSSMPPQSTDAVTAALKEYQKLQKTLNLALQESPAIKEIAQLQRQVRDLQRLKIPLPELDVIRDANKTVLAFKNHTKGLEDIRKVLANFQKLRNAAVHALPGAERVMPAYSLVDGDHD